MNQKIEQRMRKHNNESEKNKTGQYIVVFKVIKPVD